MEAAKVPGGQIRRLHIIYFLSRSGCRIEHPHLIRVHHLARNGVYLRDIKRWLGELRGKELPEAFAWSYKRRYKAGYVWQDLLDDDLITPISDNEYVLKGSQISPTLLETGSLGAVDKKASIPRQQQCLKEEPKIQTYPQSATDTPSKVSSEISQESDRSTLTDEYDCSKFEQNPDEQSSERLTENYTLPPLYQNLLNRKSRKQRTEDEIVNNNKTDAPDDSSFSTSSSSSSSSKFSFDKCRSNSTRGSFVFRNLITCGNADVSDAVLVMLNKKGSNKPNNGELSSEICKRDKLGGSATGFANSWSHQKHQQYGARRSYDGGETNKNKNKPGEFMTQNHPKPFGGPTCSQCGKKFRPEKMHKHMKSCRGMKSLSKSAEKTAPPRSSTSSNTDSTSFLPFKI